MDISSYFSCFTSCFPSQNHDDDDGDHVETKQKEIEITPVEDPREPRNDAINFLHRDFFTWDIIDDESD